MNSGQTEKIRASRPPSGGAPAGDACTTNGVCLIMAVVAHQLSQLSFGNGPGPDRTCCPRIRHRIRLKTLSEIRYRSRLSSVKAVDPAPYCGLEKPLPQLRSLKRADSGRIMVSARHRSQSMKIAKLWPRIEVSTTV